MSQVSVLPKLYMLLKELIATLKQRRIALAVTQEYVSQLSGVSLPTIKKVESGKSNPTFTTLSKIADVLGIEIKLEVKKS